MKDLDSYVINIQYESDEWVIPLRVVAEHRAAYFASTDEFDSLEESLEEDTLRLFEESSYEAVDWASNNMNWSDVEDVAVPITQAVDSGTDEPVHDPSERWVGAEKSVERMDTEKIRLHWLMSLSEGDNVITDRWWYVGGNDRCDPGTSIHILGSSRRETKMNRRSQEEEEVIKTPITCPEAGIFETTDRDISDVAAPVDPRHPANRDVATRLELQSLEEGDPLWYVEENGEREAVCVKTTGDRLRVEPLGSVFSTHNGGCVVGDATVEVVEDHDTWAVSWDQQRLGERLRNHDWKEEDPDLLERVLSIIEGSDE